MLTTRTMRDDDDDDDDIQGRLLFPQESCPVAIVISIVVLGRIKSLPIGKESRAIQTKKKNNK